MLEFYPERQVLTKERASGTYRLSAYFIAKTVASVPVRLLLPALYVSVAYPLAIDLTAQEDISYNDNVLHKSQSFLGVLGVLILTAYSGESVGLFVGSITLNMNLALSCCTAIALSMLIFGGFYVQHLPVGIRYLTYLSTVRYSFDALMQIEFYSTKYISCSSPENTLFRQCYNGGVLANDIPVASYGSDSNSLWMNIFALFALSLGFRVASYIALRFLSSSRDGRWW